MTCKFTKASEVLKFWYNSTFFTDRDQFHDLVTIQSTFKNWFGASIGSEFEQIQFQNKDLLDSILNEIYTYLILKTAIQSIISWQRLLSGINSLEQFIVEHQVHLNMMNSQSNYRMKS